MLRTTLTGLAVAAAVTTYAVPASAGDSFTTRIEPRAFYGASVTIEEGVRVFRPLPPQRQVIINPGGHRCISALTTHASPSTAGATTTFTVPHPMHTGAAAMVFPTITAAGATEALRRALVSDLTIRDNSGLRRR